MKSRSHITSELKDISAKNFVRAILNSFEVDFTTGESILGSPEFYIESCQLVIFVHGCQLHGHSCLSNSMRDREVIMRNVDIVKKLKANGFNILIIWECDLNFKPVDVQHRILRLLKIKQVI
jgi:G:T-mismatch repair DNA endonuclease (very short patch repair protein)